MTLSDPVPVYIFRSHHSPITSLCSISDSNLLVSSDEKGVIILWNLLGYKKLHTLKAHSKAVTTVSHLKEHNYLLTHGRDGFVKLWQLKLLYNLNNGDCEGVEVELVRSVQTQATGFSKMDHYQVSENCILLSIPKFETMEIWNIFEDKLMCQLGNTEAVAQTQAPRQGICMCSCFFNPTFDSTNGVPWVIVGFESGEVSVYKSHEAKETSYLHTCSAKFFSDPITNICMTSRGDTGVAGGPSNLILFFRLSMNENKTFCSVLRTVDLNTSGVSSFSIRPDNRLVFVGCWNGEVCIVERKKGILLGRLVFHGEKQSIQCLATFVSPICSSMMTNTKPLAVSMFSDSLSRNFIAAGSKDGTISLWQIY